MEPKELYNKLYENASARKKKTLQIINEACEAQAGAAVKDFSISTIARMIEGKGGLSEQGLRNKNAADYRALIDAWAKHCNTTTKKPAKSSVKGVNDEILSNISDPTTRALVGMIMAENKKLKNELSVLKQNTTLTIDMRQEIQPASNQSVVVVSSASSLTNSEITALTDSVSDEFFQKMQWSYDEYGRVKEKGRTIYKAGYVTAIKKILDSI